MSNRVATAAFNACEELHQACPSMSFDDLGERVEELNRALSAFARAGAPRAAIAVFVEKWAAAVDAPKGKA